MADMLHHTKENFNKKAKGDLIYYTIPSFEETGLVTHGFSSRWGGVSSGPYSTLNLAFHVSDVPDKVRQNRLIVCKELGIESEKLVAANQVHGDNIKVLTLEDMGRGALSQDTVIPDTDGFITNIPGLPMSTYYADCVPVLILDPVRKVIGMAHAGWKGTVLKIAQKTVLKMAETYKTKPSDCLVGIGPSIGPCCFEVDRYVYEKFSEVFHDIDFFAEEKGNKKWNIDLWLANKLQLFEIGIKAQKVTAAGICTCCNTETFYSYRAEKGKTGRMGAFLMLR